MISTWLRRTANRVQDIEMRFECFFGWPHGMRFTVTDWPSVENADVRSCWKAACKKRWKRVQGDDGKWGPWERVR